MTEDQPSSGLNELANTATIVLYKCGQCDTVVPYWATDLQIAKGNRWPPWVENKACCSNPYLTPSEARRGSVWDVRVFLRLVREGEGEAVKEFWSGLVEHSVEDLLFRPTMREEGGVA